METLSPCDLYPFSFFIAKGGEKESGSDKQKCMHYSVHSETPL